MKINIDIAKHQVIAKTWLVLQEIQEKIDLTGDIDAVIYLPVEPTKQYQREFKKMFGEYIADEYITKERVDILSGLVRKHLIMWSDDFPGMLAIETTHLYFNFYKKIKKQFKEIYKLLGEQEEILQRKDLKLNLTKGVLQFKNNIAKDISPSDDEIKYLALLMRNKRIVEYVEIARELKMNCYHPGVTNEDVARNVQYLRRDIVPVLEEVGMTRDEIKRMIVSIRNRGYKLRTK